MDTTLPTARPSEPRPLAEAWLRRTIGMDSDSIGGDTIARLVSRRMEACGETGEAAYVARLDRDAEERDRLIDEAVVPESWFFRDPVVFDFVRRSAVALAAPPASGPIRILCLPCAGGEEPYSVAIALFEAGLPAARFRIDAADVSRAALARAAAATYSLNAFRGTDASLRERWFRQSGPAFVLDDAIRAQVTFGSGNLLDESFAAGRRPYDVVFCRNLMIYLSHEARMAAERVLDRLLVPDGLLVLGATEPPILKGDWVAAAGSGFFTVRKGRRPPAPEAAAPPFPPAATPVPEVHAPEAPAGGGDLLREAHRLAGAGRPAEALALCERHLQATGPCPEVFFLLGMLHQANHEFDRAEACLEKTLYLDGDHEEALLALSLLATRRGDDPLADRYRRTAARVRSRRGAP